MSVSIRSEKGPSICDAVVQRADADNSMALADLPVARLPHGAVVVLPGDR
jgi:hypothetical protein